MSKATTVQARIQPELKEMGDAILKKVGITATVILAFYIKRCNKSNYRCESRLTQ